MKYKKIIFILILMFNFMIIMGLTEVKAATSEAYNIVTNPGEDMSTSVQINWHSNINDTFLEYTKVSDTEYQNKVVVQPEVRTFSKPANENGYLSQGFSQRYVCTVVLENLDPGTKYMYRVGKTSFSDNYYFETASGSGDFSFVHITDPQYANESGAEVFNTLLGKAYEMADVKFSFFTGDVVDRGGVESQWTMFFTRSNINKGIIATGVGNHEYYDASSTPKTYNNSWYNAFHNNPKNGPEKVLNSSYYFVYNNVLFIMLDSESKELEALKTWFSKVVEENFDRKFIIVGMHRSMYGSIYAEHSVAVRRNWQGLFDKYGVDLVLSGHDHVYARSHRVYKNKISDNSIYGTTYVIGGSGGLKFYGGKANEMYAKLVEYTSVANIITVSNNSISAQLINKDGNVLDTFSISKRRIGTKDSNFNKETFLENISIEQNDAKTAGTLKWDDNFYGNVVEMGIRRENSSSYMASLYLYNYKQTELAFDGIKPKDLNKFFVDVRFADGTVETREMTVDNVEPYYPSLSEVLEDIKNNINQSIRSIIFKEEE